MQITIGGFRCSEIHLFFCTGINVSVHFEKPFVYQYDDLGRFVEDTNAAGGGWTVTRSENQGGGYTTSMTTKEGRVTQYQVKPQDNGEMLRVNTSPDGTVNQTFINAEGETTVTRPDSTVIVSSKGPDPHFGMQAPFTSLLTLTKIGCYHHRKNG